MHQAGDVQAPAGLRFGAERENPRKPIQELLDKVGLGSCTSLFWKEQLYDMKDLMMVPNLQLQSWEEDVLQLPCRKLCTSLSQGIPALQRFVETPGSKRMAAQMAAACQI
ncbi:hypothetical protein WJX77_010652 [Trebouxia sp. C0004]